MHRRRDHTIAPLSAQGVVTAARGTLDVAKGVVTAAPCLVPPPKQRVLALETGCLPGRNRSPGAKLDFFSSFFSPRSTKGESEKLFRRLCAPPPCARAF